MADDVSDDSIDGSAPPPTSTSPEDRMDDDSHEDEKIQFNLVLRAEFIIKRNNDGKSFQAIPHVLSLIEAIIKTKTDITFKTKSGDASFKTLDKFPKGDAFKRYFPMTSLEATRQGPQKVVVEICVESPTAIDFYKTKEGTLPVFLNQNNIWICEHKFQTLKIEKIGWINQSSVQVAFKEDLEKNIRERLQGSFLTDTIPHFEAWPRTIKGSKPVGTNRARETRAYELSCEEMHAATLCTMLMTAQDHERPEARAGLFVAHSVRKAEKELHDNSIDSQNTFLNGLRKIEIIGITIDAMDTRTEALGGKCLRDYLLQHGVEDGEKVDRTTFLTIERTKETDVKGKWYLTYNESKETEVTSCVGELISNLRQNDPALFPTLSLGGKRNAGFETYRTNLWNLTPASSSPRNNGGSNRTNGNRNKNNNKTTVTIAYDDESFPEISTKTTAPMIHTPRTPLTKMHGKNTLATAASKKDTYASRVVATSVTKSTIKTTNKINDIASGKPRSDEATNLKQHSRDEDDTLLQRMAASDANIAKIESEYATRLAAIESKLIHQSAITTRMELSTSKDIQALGAMITALTAQVAALIVCVQPAPKPSTHSKRGLESSPSPNGATKHSSKRKSRVGPDPVQLDADFAHNEVHEAISEDDDGDSASMEGVEDQAYTQSRSNSPGFDTAISMEGSEAGELNTQPGSQES